MSREDLIRQKIKDLKNKGYTNNQAKAVAQQGSMYNYEKTGDKDIKPSDESNIKSATGIEFTSDFINSYFSKQSTSNQPHSEEVKDYATMPIQDITSNGQWTDRKVWRTQKPEWFLGKQEPIAGKDYTVVPYKGWKDYQNTQEYRDYTQPKTSTTTGIAGMQEGGGFYSNYFNVPELNYEFKQPSLTKNYEYESQVGMNQYDMPDRNSNGFRYNPNIIDNSLPSDVLKKENRLNSGNSDTSTYNDNTRYNILNPYGEVDLESSLMYAGQGFGEGNGYKAGMGTGLSLLKGARNMMSGYASGKESQRVKEEQYSDLYNPKINYNYAQQGGKIKNSDVLTGQYVVDQGQGNTNVEGDEYIKTAQDGKVREVLGDPHTKNGKIANGVDVTLENGDKVLSAYTKIPAKNIKELKDRYNLTLKKGATFADAQKSYDKKLGLVKETDFLSGLIEKLGKNEQIEDATTKRLNELNIVKSIETSKEKIDQLNAPKAMLFDRLFEIQESLPKKGNGKLLDDNGKVIEGQSESVAQQGAVLGEDDDPIAYEEWLKRNKEEITDPTPTAGVSSEDQKVYKIWEKKTGLSWKKAKELGYTDGSLKGNLKLLSELNDPRFKKEKLRTAPIKSQAQKSKATTPTNTDSKQKEYSYKDFQEATKNIPKGNRSTGNIGVANEGNTITRIGERLANPIQSFGYYSKYGEMPAEGFSKNDKNSYDIGLGLVNPMYWANAVGNTVDYADEGEYVRAAMEALDALPALGKIKYIKSLPMEVVDKIPGAKQLLQASTSKGLAKTVGNAVDVGRRTPLNFYEDPLRLVPNYVQIGSGAKRLGFQQGGEFETIAKKYGISVERAHELLAMQQGGMQGQAEEQVEGSASNPQEEQGGVSPEQIIQYVQQALSQGVQPEELLQQLLQEGIDEASATQMIQQVIQQMQGGQEQAPQQQEVAQEGLYSIATGISTNAKGYNTTSNRIADSDVIDGVEKIQHRTEEGFGEKMKNVEDTMNLHKWYFNSEEKKKAFREAIKSGKREEVVVNFQKAYNAEIRKRAEKAGVPKEEIDDIVNKVGFNGSGVQDFDGKFGAFTSTRPLIDFSKVADEVKITETTPDQVGKNTEEQRNITKNAIPWMPQNLRLSPSSLDPIHKEQIALPRAEAVKMTTEPMLAEQERLRQTDVARIQQSGLTVAQQEALMAQGLASSQMASNDAIGKVEQLNMDSQIKTDQFNIGQRSKEDITNAQYNQVYQGQVLGGLNAQERDWRNYYTESNLQNNQNFKDIENINMINSTKDQYAYIPGQGNVFLNNKSSDLSLDSLEANIYKYMTPEQIKDYEEGKIKETESKAGEKYKKYKMTVSNS